MTPHARRLNAFTSAFLAFLALVLAQAAGPAPGATSLRPVHTATFERGLDGWRGHRAVVRVVAGGVSGRAATVRARRTGGEFAIFRPIAGQGRPRGTVFVARGWVRGARHDQRLCLLLQEVRQGRPFGRSSRCTLATTGWQRVRQVALVKRDRGSSLRVSVRSPGSGRADRFWVDGLEVQRRRPPIPPPPNPAPPAPGASIGPAVGSQFHCTWSHYTNAQRDAVLDKLAASGIKWVRIDVGWLSIEYRGKRNYEWWYVNQLDYCVDAARARGINVLGTLWATPSWANGGQAREVPPSNLADYGDAARWVAERYRGKVAAWEVWNEPDPWQSFWRGTIQRYVDLLKTSYSAFKAGDPNALVLLGGPSSNDADWLRQVYALGAKGAFDVVATHPYQGIADQPPEAAGDGNRWWFSSVGNVKRVMDENGDGAKPIWFTEFGWSAHPTAPGAPNWQRGVTAQQQGDYLVRSIAYTKANYPYVPVMIWYKERAYPGSTDMHLEGFALLDADLSERPVLARLRSYLTGR